MKNEDKIENEESKNISDIWGADNMFNRISKIIIFIIISFVIIR